MVQKLEVTEILEKLGELPLIDVRSPGEFQAGHIPGAFNLPLFENDERAEVGTLYKQESRDAAIMAGLRIVGPKLESMVKTARSIAQKGQIMVHCWRGGMRSESVAWLLDTAGFETVYVLDGGYKAFRKEVHQTFRKKWNCWILGGMTGTGKTDILHVMRENGHQVIDLEGLANHKGSAFGGIGQADQPSTEHFENLFCMALKELDQSKVIWLENESHNLGIVNIPLDFLDQMKASPVIHFDLPKELRIQRLVHEYGDQEIEALEIAIMKIRKRLGGELVQKALKSLQSGDLAFVASIALDYYDKFYDKGLARRDPKKVFRYEIKEDNPTRNAELVIRLYKELCQKLPQAQSN